MLLADSYSSFFTGQIAASDIGDQVAEVIYVENTADGVSLVITGRSWYMEGVNMAQAVAEFVYSCAKREMGGNRSEYIPSVEGGADRLSPEIGVGDGDSLKLCPEFPFFGAGGEMIGWLGRRCVQLVYYVAQYAVIGRHEESLRRFQDDCFPLAADARVDYGQMDCPFREVAVGGAENESCLEDILWLDGVADVDDGCLGVDGQYYTLHAGHVGIAGAEVCGQSDDRGHAAFLSLLLDGEDNQDANEYK